MCYHDGIDEECGPWCRCPCDHCVLGDEDDEYEEDEDEE